MTNETMATKTTKTEMLKAAVDLLYQTAVADGDYMMLYYETEKCRFVARRGDIDKYFDMAHFCIDEAIRMKGDE